MSGKEYSTLLCVHNGEADDAVGHMALPQQSLVILDCDLEYGAQQGGHNGWILLGKACHIQLR